MEVSGFRIMCLRLFECFCTCVSHKLLLVCSTLSGGSVPDSFQFYRFTVPGGQLLIKPEEYSEIFQVHGRLLASLGSAVVYDCISFCLSRGAREQVDREAYRRRKSFR